MHSLARLAFEAYIPWWERRNGEVPLYFQGYAFIDEQCQVVFVDVGYVVDVQIAILNIEVLKWPTSTTAEPLLSCWGSCSRCR